MSSTSPQLQYAATRDAAGRKSSHALTPSGLRQSARGRRNVGQGERTASLAIGSAIALLGVARRDLSGMLIAGLGGALVYRGATGHCAAYERLGLNTADNEDEDPARRDYGVHVRQSLLVNKSPEELYQFWRDFENFPSFMTHLESVRKLDARRSHWVAKAPRLYGGSVEWDAEMTVDEPGVRIEWRTMPGSAIEHRGAVRFERALGDRGTKVRVELDYDPPFGEVGRWVAKIFGEEPEQQIRDDLRNVQRMLEMGEILITDGQPRGTCWRTTEYNR